MVETKGNSESLWHSELNLSSGDCANDSIGIVTHYTVSFHYKM